MKNTKHRMFLFVSLLIYFMSIFYGPRYPINSMQYVSYDRDSALRYADFFWDRVTSDGYFYLDGWPPLTIPAGTELKNLYRDDETGKSVHLYTGGLDCAHFVSCCIGSPPTYRDNTSRQSYKGGGLNIKREPNPTPSYGEPGANRLRSFLINKGLAVSKGYNLNNLLPGDLIYVNGGPNGQGAHVVLYMGDGQVSGHSSSQKRVSFNEYYRNYKDITFIHIYTSPNDSPPAEPDPPQEPPLKPGIPELKSPKNNDVIKNKVTLSWFSTMNATKYQVQVNQGTTLNTETSNTSYSFPNDLESGKTYYWRVRAGNSQGWGEFSNEYKFILGLAVPKLISPCNGIVDSLFIGFNWDLVEGASSYMIETYVNDQLKKRESVSGEIQIPFSSMFVQANESGFWKWRVKAKNDSFESEWSGYCYFEGRFPQGDAKKPDLVSLRFFFSKSEITEGELFFVDPVIENIGNARAGRSFVKIYLSPTDDWDLSDDVFFDSSSVDPLDPGQEIRLDLPMKPFPRVGTPYTSTYKVWIITVVDANNDVNESDENNIFKSNNPIIVTKASGRGNIVLPPPESETNKCISEGSVLTNMNEKPKKTLLIPLIHDLIYFYRNKLVNS